MALITGLKGGTTNITVSYGGKTTTVSNFTVNKKTVTFSAPTLKSVSAYTRSSQTLVNAGSCTTGGTMYYYVSTSSSTPTFSVSSWTTTVPSKKDVGTYYLWYYVYVSDTGAYIGTGINTVTKVGTGSVTIPKQTPVLSTSPTKKGDWSYNGTEYALASGGAMKHSSTDSTPVAGAFTYAKATNPGTYTASWSFTPTDTTNYNSTSGNVGTVTVSKASITSLSSSEKIIYNRGGYNTFTITPYPSGATVSYSSSSTSIASVTNAGVVTYVGAGDATITVTGTGNYTGTLYCYVHCVVDTVISYKDYQVPTGLTISGSVVPASGGTSTITWSGTCKQNATAVYASGYTEYTSLTISNPTTSISGNSSVPSKGKNVSDVTTAISTVTGTYTANGKSSTTTCSVYQAANTVGSYYDTSVNTYGTPSLTLTNNLTAGGGSVKVTCSVTDTYNTRRDYTSGSYDTSTRTATGTACWRITSNGNSRFGYSGTAHSHSSTNYYDNGTTATHSSMTSNVGTDTVGITAYNHGDLSKTSGQKTASITNSLQSTKYKSKSTSDKGFNATYGTPTISIGSGITAGGGSATVSASVTNTAKWYQIYDSGTWTGEQSSSNGSVISNSVSLSITSQYIATSSNADSGTTITRFSISGTTLKHSSMDKSIGWDTVNVKVTNDASTGKTATARTYVQNSVSAWKNTTVYAYGTPTKVTFSGSSNESRCAGGNTTMSATVTDTYSRKRTYTSGSYDTDTNGSAAGSVGYEFVSRTCNDGSTATSYWNISGSTLTHRNMGTKWVTDYCVVRAYNAGSSTIKGANSDELSASNVRSEVNIKYYASCSISNGITASGGSATVSYSGYHTANYKYASGTTDSSLHETNDGATIKITSQTCAGGTNRFTLSGSTLSHSTMGTTTGTDSVTITATNSANTSITKTATKSVTNSLESISITLGSPAVSKSGNDATGHPSSAHYDLVYSSSTEPIVIATYTSGSTANVTSSSTFTSSDITVATIS